MSNKICLSVVVFLAMSFAALAKVDSNESEEAEWDDLFFGIFFEDSVESSEEVPTDFGPEFNPRQFLSRLNVDIENAYRRKCKKISGSDDTYDKIEAAKKELGKCLKSFSKLEEFQTKSEPEDNKNIVRNLCRKRDIPIKCIENYIAVDDQCSFPSEIEEGKSIFRISLNFLDLFCGNDGNDLISLVDNGRDCAIEKKVEVKTCANKALYEIVKGFLVRMIEVEEFDLTMDAENCRTYDETKTCFVSAVESCAEPTPKKFISSVFDIVR
ncbi:27 kDa hemolymph protein, partial [Pseudolycoriella hygida]